MSLQGGLHVSASHLVQKKKATGKKLVANGVV